MSLLHRLPQVFLTCFAFFWWLLGLVMIQHSIRTSLYNLCANVLFSCACTSSWLLWTPTSLEGPSSSTRSPPVCGSLRFACWLSVGIQYVRCGLDTNTTANENPTNTPNANVNNDRRLAIAREPDVQHHKDGKNEKS